MFIDDIKLRRKGNSQKRAKPMKPYLQSFKAGNYRGREFMKRSFDKKLNKTGKNAHELTGLVTYAESIKNINSEISKSQARVSSESREKSRKSRELKNKYFGDIRSEGTKDNLDNLALNLTNHVRIIN